MGLRVSLCEFCRHRRAGQTCAAFPGGIPIEVYWGDFDHRLPHPDDHGIQFEASEEAEKSYFYDFAPPNG
jgi:hypothetical protein